MKAVIYARVSTDEQADKGYSLPTQIEACRRYAVAHGYEVIAEFREDHSGAVPISDRPEGKKLAALLKQHEAQAMITYCVDRLSRDIVDLLASVREWIRAGIHIHACDIGKVESELDIVLVIKGWQGSDERKKIIERTTRGKNAKAQSGRVVGCGNAPYGYRFIDGQFQIHEGEAQIVRMIFRWYTEGDDGIKSLTQYMITRRLCEMEIPSPGVRQGRASNRGLAIWNTYAVSRILKEEVYAGLWRYGKKIGNGGKGGRRPQEQQIQVEVPAIIDRKIWDTAQMRRAYNRRMSARNANHQYLLRGLVQCKCGKSMSGVTYRGRSYHRCNRRTRQLVGLEPAVCKQRAVRADILEELTWSYLATILADACQLEDLLRKAQEEDSAKLQPKRELLESLEQAIKQTEEEAIKLAGALKNTSGGIVGRTLQAQIEQLDALYNAQIQRRNEIAKTLEIEALTDEQIDTALQFRQDIVGGLKDPTFEDKRRILEVLRVAIHVEGRMAQVSCLLPLTPVTFDLRISPNVLQWSGADTISMSTRSLRHSFARTALRTH